MQRDHKGFLAPDLRVKVVVQACRSHLRRTTCCTGRIMSGVLADAASVPEANLSSTCISEHEHCEQGTPGVYQVHQGIVDAEGEGD